MMTDEAIAVEPCERCAGWHPQRKTCPPRKTLWPYVACKVCGCWHFRDNARYCSGRRPR